MTDLAQQEQPTDLCRTPAGSVSTDRRGLGRPLSVCMMVDNLARAGVETQMLQLIARMDRSVITPHLCLLEGTGEASRALEPTDCHVERLGVKSLRRPSTLGKALRFAKYLRRHKIDVLHPHFQDSMYFAAPIAKWVGVPSVVRFRVNIGYWMRPIDRRLMRFYNRFINATLVNCRACGDAVTEQEHAPPESITIIPNGVDLTKFECFRSDAIGQWKPGAVRTIGVVANLRNVKGIDVLIRAAAQLVKQHENVRFVVAGEGDLRGELESLIAELRLGDRFALPGRVDDVPSFLRDVDIAVLSSRSEGAPNVIMEYMAAGKPVVATDVGGVGEIVEAGQTGLLVPPDNPADLAEAIATLLDNTVMAHDFAKAGQQRAFAEFGLSLQAKRYEEFYSACYERART